MAYTFYLIPLLILLFLWLLRKFFFNAPFTNKKRNMKNKVVIITGSSAGIGKETAYDILKNDGTVIYACRDEEKTMNIIKQLPIGFQTRSVFIKLDLFSFASIYQFVEEFLKIFDKVDILINNAGLAKQEFNLTENKIETTLQANHIGHMLLTSLLLDKFNTNEGRIINVSSDAHWFADINIKQIKDLESNLNFDGIYYSGTKGATKQYGNSKLANIYFTQYLKEFLELKFKHIKTVCLHPGFVNTELYRVGRGLLPYVIEIMLSYILYPIFYYFSKSSVVGAQTTLHLCYEQLIENGEYYQNCKKSNKCSNTKDSELQREFMKYSWMLIDKVNVDFIKFKNLLNRF